MMSKLDGLIAATHTPFDSDGALNQAAVEKQAEHLLQADVAGVFVGGTTGESHSLTVEERLSLATRWSEVVKGSNLRLVIHVGSNCLTDAKTLAAQAQSLGADAIAAVAPSYFKPQSLDDLVDCCKEISGKAPSVPFYYYDIPGMTGIQFSMPEFLTLASDQIPTLAGIKFTNIDLSAFQKCLRAADGRFVLLWGIDEILLAAMALGATGAVGSTYNFAAPLYHDLLQAFSRGDHAAARQAQYQSVQLVELLSEFGYLAASKAVMGFLGVDVGPVRLPLAKLSTEQCAQLRTGLERIGFFEWVGK